MKSYLLSLIILLMLSPAYAQKSSIAEDNAAKFLKYFNAGRTDSLHTLLADDIKPKLPLAMLEGAVQQLKGGFGSLVACAYFEHHEGTAIYIATFERSGPVLYINFDNASKVIGFFMNVDKRETPGSVTFKTANAVLKGTLSLPEMTVPVPVVLLIAGSGPTDRDGNSTLVNGKSNYFLQLSDALKQKNIAALRYDKRAIGQSTTTKPIKDITFDDMVDDAAALVKVLKTDKRFSKVIVAGHSEGSLIGMLAARREKADAFISLSGPGLPADVMLKTQLKVAFPADDYARAVSIIDSIKAGNFTKQKVGGSFDALFNQAVQPYLFSLMKYDPRQEISKLTIPVLIVQGTNDIQVSVKDAEALKKAGPNAQLRLIPGMSHILKAGPADRLQNAATYAMPDLPLHADLVPILFQFINKSH
jgi:pimeloyl-ACP methyl ester carboxylesterase